MERCEHCGRLMPKNEMVTVMGDEFSIRACRDYDTCCEIAERIAEQSYPQ